MGRHTTKYKPGDLPISKNDLNALGGRVINDVII
jgi:hypothetical protein